MLFNGWVPTHPCTRTLDAVFAFVINFLVSDLPVCHPSQTTTGMSIKLTESFEPLKDTVAFEGFTFSVRAKSKGALVFFFFCTCLRALPLCAATHGRNLSPIGTPRRRLPPPPTHTPSSLARWC